MSSARGRVQSPGFRDIGTAAHVVVIPFRSSSIAKSRSIVGVKSNRLVVIGDGSIVVAFIHISVTPVLEGEGAFGIESNCRVEIGNGSLIVAFVCMYDASVPKGMGALGIESNGLIKIGERSVVGAFACESDAPVANSQGAGGIKSNSLAVITDCLTNVALMLVGQHLWRRGSRRVFSLSASSADSRFT